MKLTRVIVTMDMKPDTYHKWKRLSEIYDITMEQYFKNLIEDACNESWIADELRNELKGK
jgi:hypothetical protein